MIAPYVTYLRGLPELQFRDANAQEKARLEELVMQGMPAEWVPLLQNAAADGESECGEFVLYGLSRICDENLDYIPGANVLPLGLFTIASWSDGDAVCIDLHDGSVWSCPHELLGDETVITLYEDGAFTELPFDAENVRRVSHCMADSIAEFVQSLRDEAFDEE
ncbi:MAG TPA: hypothetical protein DDX71_07455 [Ruminococcus sp.]|nr:hypothetical protein [Ruminococcus sp.]